MPEIIRGFRGKYYFLSNFSNYPVEYEGVFYPTSEHAFQAAKFNNIEYRKQICNASTPGEAKGLGRSRKFPVRKHWDDGLAIQAMSQIIANKFRNNPELKDLLLETGDAILVETNDWNDDVWGDSTTTETAGRNQLGIILMTVRASLS